MSFLRQGFCFTGKAKLNGVDVVRGDLERFIRQRGGIVCNKVDRNTDILVASRTDTTKAADALSQGKRVITYDEFFTMAGVTSHFDLRQMSDDERRALEQVELAKKAEEDAKRAAKEAKSRAKVEAAMDQAAEEIEGWGMF